MDESDSELGSLNASSIMRWPPANDTNELYRNGTELSNEHQLFNLTYSHVNYGDNNYWALLALILVVSNCQLKTKAKV